MSRVGTVGTEVGTRNLLVYKNKKVIFTVLFPCSQLLSSLYSRIVWFHCHERYTRLQDPGSKHWEHGNRTLAFDIRLRFGCQIVMVASSSLRGAPFITTIAIEFGVGTPIAYPTLAADFILTLSRTSSDQNSVVEFSFNLMARATAVLEQPFCKV